ncbi:phage tail tube protein (plasmid) [Arsenophonus nasoniae]|uniref:Phage tail tube protein n=1 Tax=Arsenophonus nasoniae TaxID=638 RepID=A0A4P7L2I2_9GAMM|nr:phage tail tube protein [Arsenophonus nasoniae]QBY46979.1 Phage tail tube protein [Arsenophonus nasoniae]WGM04027.1 phage tail tube protein [Arsenophonus nasoniae]WGM09166.1 phage tail tube protein [Arsenophonus nasoniae]WGM18542.1 phage tail tube protein [Arsenophonus nasoniae]
MQMVAGTCYFKVDGEQLAVEGGIEVPLNTVVRESIIGSAGEVFFKETHRAPYVKVKAIFPKNFPINKITTNTSMTITAELANGTVYVLASASLVGEANHNTEDGTVELEFNGEEGFYQ